MTQPDLQADTHVHTRLCNHASGEMEEYVLTALERGLASLTFLEHLEAGIEYPERTWLTEEHFQEYFRVGKRLQEKYQDRIAIRLGVELGYNPDKVDTLRTRLAAHRWERIGLSYHFLFDGARHLNMVSRRKRNIEALASLGPERVVTRYLDGLIQALRQFDCDQLCHLDAVMRHYPGLHFGETHWQQVETLLGIMRKKGIELELNTSGFSLRGEPYPCRRIVDMARTMGIGLVAGSDAHRPEQVGRDFDRLADFLGS
ncbi:MAG: histidinol-phosphatase HisJ [Desulfobulbaceae bacterium]